MTYTDYKFFEPPEELTNEEKIEQQKNIVNDLEAVYWKATQDSSFTEFDLSAMENQLMAERKKYEDLGGAYE
tara:strand:+ start:1389 stop:1604 length:216 start_codon:yes stop_codon:yes gene_type:complete